MKVIDRYRTMWLIVFFDLPTETIAERKNYARFRKGLLKSGFSMMQYSVYTRHCASVENANTHRLRVKAMLPSKGMVSILTITDKQFGDIQNFWGAKRKKVDPPPKQLEMF